MRRGGSLIHIENWSDAYGWGKIPKLWLYDGNHGRMLLLNEFNFTQLSFHAMKIYMAILAFSRYRDHQLRPPGGLHWRTKHHIAYAVTRLYDMQLISFRPGEFHCEHQFECQQISGAQLWYTLAGTGGRKAGGQKWYVKGLPQATWPLWCRIWCVTSMPITGYASFPNPTM